MTSNGSGRTATIVAILVGAGAFLSGLINFLLLLTGASLPYRFSILQDPIGFALRPNAPPLALAAMFLGLILLTGLTWLFVRWVAASALPGRGAAAFFGTWGAVIIASWIAGIVRAPVTLMVMRLPENQTELIASQFQQIASISAYWGLMWGWIVAVVALLLHRSAGRRATQSSAPGPVQPAMYPQQPAPSAPHLYAPTPPPFRNDGSAS